MTSNVINTRYKRFTKKKKRNTKWLNQINKIRTNEEISKPLGQKFQHSTIQFFKKKKKLRNP